MPPEQPYAQQTDAEAHVAQALAAQQHCLLVFASPTCRLCNSLAPHIAAAKEAYAGQLQVAHVHADNDVLFTPELLRFNVERVPCFIMVDPSGKATRRTHPPTGFRQMYLELKALLSHTFDSAS